MPPFRHISSLVRSHHHSAHASRHLSDMCDASHNSSYYTPYDSIKSEPIDASIPCISPSPSASSESCISPCLAYAHSNVKEDSIAPLQPRASPFPALSDTSSLSKGPSSQTKNIHGRRREPGYVPRPRNAFIVYRSDYIERHRHLGEDQQNELSKQAGRAWNRLPEDSKEKKRFREIAAREQEAHKIAHPGYQYYGPGEAGRAVSSARARKAAARVRRIVVVEGNRRSPSRSPSESAAAYSPEIDPSRPRASRAPRAAARVAAQRIEQLASAPSLQVTSPSPATSEPICPTTDTAMPESSPTVVSDAFVPTQSTPVFALDDDAAGRQTKEQTRDEPVFTLDLPPTLRYDSEYEQFGLGVQPGFDVYSTCVPAPFSTLPSVVPLPTVMSGIRTAETTMLCDWSTSTQLATPELDLGYSPLSLSEDLGTMGNVGYINEQMYTDAAQSAYDLDFWIQPEILSFSEGMDA